MCLCSQDYCMSCVGDSQQKYMCVTCLCCCAFARVCARACAFAVACALLRQQVLTSLSGALGRVVCAHFAVL